MDEKTRRALNAINRHFYQHHAERFSETRSKPWQGWDYVVRRLLERSVGKPAEPLRVLDVGCGNGRFGELLHQKFPRAVEYLGIDSSAPLLEHARARLQGRGDWDVEFVQHDFVEAGLAEVVGERFDLVVLFGVLHHIPGAEVRQRLVGELLGSLAPGGEVVLSVWRFAEDPRYERRVVSWEEHNAWVRESGVGVEMLVDAGEVEEGDVLLRWGGRESSWWRYCHAVGEGELGELVKRGGGIVVEAGVGDGGNGYWWVKLES